MADEATQGVEAEIGFVATDDEPDEGCGPRGKDAEDVHRCGEAAFGLGGAIH